MTLPLPESVDLGDFIGSCLIELRRKRGLTQEQVACAFGLGMNGVRQVRRWERGQIPNWISRLTLPWQEVYGMSYADLVKRALR